MTYWQSLWRTAVARTYKVTGAMWVHERLLAPRFLTILLFHRVTDQIPDDGLTVSVARFRRLCQRLKAGFRVVPLADVFAILRDGRPIPPRTVAITFDDCYRDNLQAAEILSQFGLPATFFLPTAFVGTDRVFEWDRGLPALGNLSWKQVCEIAALGHDIGSHSVTHADFGRVGPEQAWAELSDSRRELEDRLGRPCRHFAFPYGGPQHVRPEYVPLIERAGYEGAVSAHGGFVRPGTDPRVLPREAVPWFKSLDHLEMHLSGCLHWWYDLRGRDRSLALIHDRKDAGHLQPALTGPH